MPVHWVAGLAGHMKQSSAGASFTSRHHITSLGLSVLSRSSLCPRDELSSASHQPCLPVAACRRLDASCALCPRVRLLRRLACSCSPTARETFSWTVMAPNLVFDIALTLLLVEEAKRSGKRLCSQEFLVFLVVVVVCCF